MKNVQKLFRVMNALLLICFPFSSLSASAQTVMTADPSDLMMEGVANNQMLDPTGATFKPQGGDDLEDHKAEVFFASGGVEILKKGARDWQAIQKGNLIEEGDQILTAAGGYVEIAYDKHMLDIARIGEKTRAEFLSIEPTNLLLEDGSVFSALDGLKKGSSYQVSTPTAVAAVRGTHFDVSYSAQSGEFFAATIPVADDGHESRIEVTDVLADGASGEKTDIHEGAQVQLHLGEALSPNLVQTIQPEVREKAEGIFQGMGKRDEHFTELRKEGLEILDQPYRGEEGMDPNHQDNPRDEMPRDRKDGDDHKPVEPPHDGPGGGGDHHPLFDGTRPPVVKFDPTDPRPVEPIIPGGDVKPPVPVVEQPHVIEHIRAMIVPRIEQETRQLVQTAVQNEARPPIHEGSSGQQPAPGAPLVLQQNQNNSGEQLPPS